MEKEKSNVISNKVQNYIVSLNNAEINLKILYEDNHIIVVEKLVKYSFSRRQDCRFRYVNYNKGIFKN